MPNHIHRFMVEPPQARGDGTSKGVCQDCGTEQEFNNVWDGDRLDGRGYTRRGRPRNGFEADNARREQVQQQTGIRVAFHEVAR